MVALVGCEYINSLTVIEAWPNDLEVVSLGPAAPDLDPRKMMVIYSED
jgi:hypothetical protein